MHKQTVHPHSCGEQAVRQIVRVWKWPWNGVEASTDDLWIEFGYLLFGDDNVPARRTNAELMAMRKEYLVKGEVFPLDQVALIALNRIVVRPLRFAQVTDQLGRVLAVAYDYPQFAKDPVLPVSLVPIGPKFGSRLRRLARHIDQYGSGAFTDQQRWGKRAQRLVSRINDSLHGDSGLSRQELNFISYHLDLTIAQPWRRS